MGWTFFIFNDINYAGDSIKPGRKNILLRTDKFLKDRNSFRKEIVIRVMLKQWDLTKSDKPH